MNKTNVNPVTTDKLTRLPYQKTHSTEDSYSLESYKYGQMNDAVKRYRISRSTFTRLRDNDPEFPTWFKRGSLGIYDFSKLDKYFSA